ncbi:hypothetical protein ACR79M_09600 [Sphingobacterium spiritivorum]|uniref:hypothetical protein n=1 Tax=Sphingobacterium spiritivorum TaxID=258 RepID=UPI003DA4A702
MKGYSIVENYEIEPHIRFLRIAPTNLKLTLKNIMDSLMDLSWIGQFDEDFLRASYTIRANESIEYITKNIFNEIEDTVTSNAGEYIVSELARLSVVSSFSYLDIPLAELLKKQKVGNPGFDFYTASNNKHLLFGEAKYVSKQNAYGRALSQVVNFQSSQQHIADIADINNFFCPETLSNCMSGQLGFMIAFSSKKTETKKLITGIKNNLDYQKLQVFKEIILIAVNI